MQWLNAITLATNVSTTGAQAQVDVLHSEDTYVLYPYTTGGSVNISVNIEVQSPAGNWHVIAQKTYTSAGAQAPIQLNFLPGQSIRANITAASAGTLSISGHRASSVRS